ncbi:MAG: hypothetical protein A3E83_07810 [Gammaproteobacteria bacterium RIFCSPHIGHO2_12_FULL_41_20]|nr:MAG: hypothetical protein A3E83_07810 [Gammaproteobacteria bacterium RIFCSPHIGHO2_12_FULL_41_20]
MKVKSIVMLALSAFVATSIAYADPDADAGMNLADNSSGNNIGQMPSSGDGSAQSQDQGGASTDSAGATTGGDEGGSDTATGDDDY